MSLDSARKVRSFHVVRRLYRHLGSAIIALTLASACGPKAPAADAASKSNDTPTPTAPAAPPDNTAALAAPSLAEKLKDYFPVGTAAEPYLLDEMGDVVARHFNRLTAENAMKLGPICPRPGACEYAAADKVAAFARAHQMPMTGHAFVWHQMYPAWFFKNESKPAAASIVQQRMHDHIFTMMQRYADVVDNWDVVNEAISDTAGKTYRDESEGSKFYEAFAGKEYIKVAFQEAAAAAAAHDPTVKLYYNDYNVEEPEKLAKTLEMVRWLRKEGVRVDGVGIQAHWHLASPTLDVIRNAIDTLVAEKLEVKFSELDISVYDEDDYGKKVYAKEMPLTPELEAKITQRYKEIFQLFREKAKVIAHVTFWGVSDDHTWLNGWPLARKNYPLLFDRQHQPKPAFHAIVGE